MLRSPATLLDGLRESLQECRRLGDVARRAVFDQGPRGEVYLLQDGEGAKLLRLEPAR